MARRIDSSQSTLPTAAGRPRRFLQANKSKILWGLFALLCLRFLAVDLYPVITNDSIGYLGHSNNLTEAGFVRAGYRQIGYPLFLALVDWIGDIIRMEPLMLTALTQRLLLLGGLAYTTWLFKFWSLPLIFIGTTPTLIAYTNFVLTEGLAIPLAVVYACLVSHAIQLVSVKERHAVGQRFLRAIIAAVGVIFLLLVFLRSQYVLLGIGVVALALLLYKNGARQRRWAIALISGPTLLGLTFFGLMSIENQTEYGTFFPVVRTERGSYWATWSLVFRDPLMRQRAGVADLYADGDPYHFIRIVDSDPGLDEQRERFAAAITRLIEASGSTPNEQRFLSTLGALVGGRLDDIRGIVRQVATARPSDVEQVIHRNAWATDYGVGAFIDQFNDGEEIVPVIVSPLAPVRSSPYIVDLLRLALPIAYVVLIIGALLPSTRFLAIVALLAQLLSSVAAGLLFVDNTRYLVVPSVFTLGVATAVASAMWSGWTGISARPTWRRQLADAR